MSFIEDSPTFDTPAQLPLTLGDLVAIHWAMEHVIVPADAFSPKEKGNFFDLYVRVGEYLEAAGLEQV